MEDEKHLTFAEAWDRLTPEAKEAVLRELPKTGTQDDGQDPKEGWERMSLQERRDLLSRLIAPAILRKDESSDWIRGTFFHLVSNAIHNLHRYLEDATDEDISWESPFVELQIPAGPEAPPVLTTEPSDEDLSFEKVVETLAFKFLRVREATVLMELTGGAVIVRKDGTEFPVVPPELAEKMKTWPEKKRRRFEENYGEPFVLGGTYFEEGRDFQTTQSAAIKVLTGEAFLEEVDVPEVDIPEDEPARLTRSGRKRLRGVTPFLAITGDHNGTPFSGSLIVAFHPLLVDEDNGRSYFPVVVGIQFFGENPAEWTREDKEELWNTILSTVDKLRDEVFPEKSETVSTKPGTQSQEPEPPRSLSQEDARSTKTEIPVTSTVDTMEALSRFTPSAPVPMGPPPFSRTHYLLDGRSRLSRKSVDFLRHSVHISFPRKWSSVPRWEDLVEKEKTYLLGTFGEDAFRDTDGGPALLQRRTMTGRDETGKRVSREEVFLTRAAERELEERRPFAKIEKDFTGFTREHLVRVIRYGSERIKYRVSWFEKAVFLAGDGLETKHSELLDRKKRLEQADLFDPFAERKRAEIDEDIRRTVLISYGWRLMEKVLLDCGLRGENPIRVPAHDLKLLFECERDPEAMSRINGCLGALHQLRFSYELEGSRESLRYYSPFVKSFGYKGRGPGDHSEGDFYIEVSPDFFGCLEAFAVKSTGGRAAKTVFEWTKKLTKEEKKVFGKDPYHQLSAIGPYFHKAMKFTDHQSHLCRWIENERTRKSDGTRRDRKRLRVKRSVSDAQELRLYGHDFCPLIPEGTLLAGALGHFPANGETGRKLYGTETRATKTGGGHTEGLLAVLVYPYPPGAAKKEREEILEKSLQDIVRVVREALDGVVAAQTPDGRWMSLEDAKKLSLIHISEPTRPY